MAVTAFSSTTSMPRPALPPRFPGDDQPFDQSLSLFGHGRDPRGFSRLRSAASRAADFFVSRSPGTDVIGD
ncbi:hypothetical protein ABZS61_34460, partial [Streptomyces sp. NPDC005566]|uniref:hypothetical protein n=1 Tax=Streptomyces sp. NPDC005566 TaxID=3156886 RepID=UPI0033A30F3B